MAKLGEQDSRWIVSSRVDGKNVANWHWAEKNLSNTMKARVTEMLQGLQLVDGAVVITFTEIEKVEGDMTAMNRKGKTKYVYDFNIKLKWKGEYAPEGGDRVEATGSLELIDVIVDDNDYQHKLVVDNEDRSKLPIKDCLKKSVNKKVQQIFDALIAECQETIQIQQPTDQVQVIQPDAPVKLVQGSPVSLSTSTSAKTIEPVKRTNSSLETKSIKQVITFEVPPQPLYEILTDERKISAFTQSPCKFSTISPGGEFHMFGGNVLGTQILLDPSKKIEQNWRFSSWPENHFSIVKLDFEDLGSQCKLTLTQTGVPAHDFDRTKSGWEEYFWIRIRGLCGWNYKITQ